MNKEKVTIFQLELQRTKESIAAVKAIEIVFNLFNENRHALREVEGDIEVVLQIETDRSKGWAERIGRDNNFILSIKNVSTGKIVCEKVFYEKHTEKEIFKFLELTVKKVKNFSDFLSWVHGNMSVSIINLVFDNALNAQKKYEKQQQKGEK